ncbi:sigma 54-interacting transcriptional regulator [Bizionia echini]|nr:sigma 54-interacting transcriptional regulator [Bizionia echini]
MMCAQLQKIWSELNPNELAKVLHEKALICFLNQSGKFMYVSQPLTVLLECDESELLNKSINSLQCTKVEQQAKHPLWGIISNETFWNGYIDLSTKRGKDLRVLTTFALLENKELHESYYIGIFDLNPLHVDFQMFKENDSCYNSFFNNSPIPKSVFDLETFKYVDVNEAWEDYTGFNRNNALNHTPNELKLHTVFNSEFINTIKSSENISISHDKVELINHSDSIKHATLTFKKIFIHNQAYLLEIIMDSTERLKYQKVLEKISKKSVQKKDVILKLAGLVGGDLSYVFKEITRLAAKTMRIERVSIWQFEEGKNTIACQSAYNLKEHDYFKQVEFKAHDYPKYFQYLFKHKTLRVDDAIHSEQTEEFAERYLKPLNITATLDVLIQGHQTHYGVLCFEHIGSKKEWTIEDEEFATSIANIISLAVECDKRNTAEIELIKSNQKLVGLNSELKNLQKKLEQENIYLREEIDLVFNYEEMVYGSKSFSQVLTDVERVATTNATVLLLGESGTGKELLARAIHNTSSRKSKPLIKVNCAAIPKELIESELFGHKKGSFTGAISDKLGKFQLADGGTLFLDEIGELPLDMQPKLLRAIQESEIEPIGGTKTQKVDIRIIAATNRDLQEEVQAKNFREDLYFRINVFPIIIPPLRERIEDIPILLEHFVNKYSKLYSKSVKYISEETKRDLQSYSWPGNIRELENLVERAIILSNDEKLKIPNFKSSEKESLISSTNLSLDDVQRIHIKKILHKTNWKIEGPDGAAELLQMKPSTLRDRMKKLGLKKLT